MPIGGIAAPERTLASSPSLAQAGAGSPRRIADVIEAIVERALNSTFGGKRHHQIVRLDHGRERFSSRATIVLLQHDDASWVQETVDVCEELAVKVPPGIV